MNWQIEVFHPGGRRCTVTGSSFGPNWYRVFRPGFNARLNFVLQVVYRRDSLQAAFRLAMKPIRLAAQPTFL